ncbi:MAG TPA: ribosome rescue protein RqcH, partial [Candidatus Thermoplasmatota archaeon]|nr:ribosome rescue protein RqcH [Candidatus Thermoplasmatota archaeon]
MRRKEEMSALDVRAAVREMAALRGARIDKAYEPAQGELLLRVRGGTPPKRQDVSILVGKAVHLTTQPRENPEKPGGFVMQIRKHLANAFVDDVRQHGFDRVIEFVSRRKDGTYVLVVELFHDGNVVLVKDDRIVSPLFTQSWATREIRPGAEWVPPPARVDPAALSREEFAARMRQSNADAVRTLATEMNLGGAVAEEVCALAGVPKGTAMAGAPDETLDKLLDALRGVFARVESGALDPVVATKGEEKVDVAPFPMRAHEGLDLRRFPTFHEALDDYFGRVGGTAAAPRADPRVAKLDAERVKTQRMLDAQTAALARFKTEDAEARRKGDLLYGHFDLAQRVARSLLEAGKAIGWKEVAARLKEGKAKGNPEAAVVESVLGHEGAAVLALEDEHGKRVKVRVDLRKTVQENADAYYETSKKMREKRKGALEALARTKARIAELDARGVELVQELEERKARAPATKRFWFETFRWFVTSDGHVVVAGRDVRSNEKVVAKNLEDKDRYLHADVSGAPSTVVKARDGQVSAAALEEAACFAASMSRVWNAGHASAEAYWVTPEQVSKTPNPGEYLAKGAFIIRGKRNFLRVPVRLAVGEVEIDGARKVMGGPVAAVASR